MNQSFILKDGRGVGNMFHASTESIIALLGRLDFESDRAFQALDVGTGSGLLAMVIASKWPNSKVLATDISKQAVLDARENIRENSLERQIQCIQAEGLDHPEISKSAPYGLITANLVAKYHVQYIAQMQEILADSGIIIISGILLARLQEVEEALAHSSLAIIAKVESNGWVTLVLSKSLSSSGLDEVSPKGLRSLTPGDPSILQLDPRI